MHHGQLVEVSIEQALHDTPGERTSAHVRPADRSAGRRQSAVGDTGQRRHNRAASGSRSGQAGTAGDPAGKGAFREAVGFTGRTGQRSLLRSSLDAAAIRALNEKARCMNRLQQRAMPFAIRVADP